MSFLNPLFLLGLAAVAVPIIVHLVRRTRAPIVEFPSLMFVRRIPQRTIRRRRLHNILLLLLRTLAFLLIVLAFVRPYFSSSQASGSDEISANIIMLDTSMSMQYGDRFEQARNRAAALIDDTRANDRTALITFDDNFNIQSRFSNDKGKLKSLLSSIKPGYGATGYLQALRGADTLFKEAEGATRRLYLITDNQSSGFNATEEPYRLGDDVKLEVIDTGRENHSNLAVTNVNAIPAIFQPKYTDKLSARIANFGDEEKKGVRVEFLLNDRTVEKREVRIAAGDAATIEFTGFNLTDGTNRGTIQVDGDDFSIDNKFYLKLRRDEQMKTLVIETASRGRSESFYLRNAMTTGENLPFKLEVKTAGSVDPTEVKRYRVIFLNDAVPVSQALATQLIRFVEAGGGLIISTGPHTDIATFNKLFADFAPAKLDGASQLRGEYVALSEIKTDHPIFEIFRQSGRLTSARVFGYHKSSPRAEAAVIARFEDGSPALLESNYGKGKVLLYTSTFDGSWNDLPLTPIYLPLVRQMTRYLANFEEGSWNTVGRTFTVPPVSDGSVPAVDSPSGERLKDKNQTSTGELIIDPKETGFYRLRYPEQSDYAAVNSISAESDLTRFDINAFIKTVTGTDAKTSDPTVSAGKLSNEEIESGQRVWWLLLIAAFFLFITEAIMAGRIKSAKVIN